MNQILTQQQFEDILFNPDLVVVQKDVSSHLEHTTYAYVYEGKLPIYVAVRHITDKGVSYWKEAI
ncbi:modifier of suppressor tRNAs [Citrobacter phage CkP1]|nr:modifier of suppressor tRNAs [Citrobacter phage CkP1]